MFCKLSDEELLVIKDGPIIFKRTLFSMALSVKHTIFFNLCTSPRMCLFLVNFIGYDNLCVTSAACYIHIVMIRCWASNGNW